MDSDQLIARAVDARDRATAALLDAQRLPRPMETRSIDGAGLEVSDMATLFMYLSTATQQLSGLVEAMDALIARIRAGAPNLDVQRQVEKTITRTDAQTGDVIQQTIKIRERTRLRF